MKFSELKPKQYFEDNEGSLMIKLSDRFALDGIHCTKAFKYEPDAQCEPKGQYEGNLDAIINQLPK